jgi:phage-related holin
MDNFLKIGSKLAAATTTVNGWIAAVVIYLTPLYGVFWLMLILLIADFFTGIGASAKQHIPRSSKRLRRSASKMLCYFGIIYLFWEFETQLGVDWVATYKFIAGFIFLVEIISILENMFVITEHPVFAKLIKIVRGKAASHHKDGSLLEDILNEKNEK